MTTSQNRIIIQSTAGDLCVRSASHVTEFTSRVLNWRGTLAFSALAGGSLTVERNGILQAFIRLSWAFRIAVGGGKE